MNRRIFLIILGQSILSIPCWAEVNTDGSVGPATQLNGPNFQIGEALGTRVGDNLFHSFSQFNINAQESATFTGDSAIQNVISRVTGGNVSVIDGLFRSEIGQAGVYFINPAGIVFGDHAQVDVPAAFYTSTAGALNFTDGAQFNALNPAGSHLSIAAPSSFGFNADHTGSIVIEADGLQFKPQSKVEFSAQQIEINQAQVGGENVDLTLNTNTTPRTPAGPININGSLVAAAGNGTGHVQINGGDVTLSNSNVLAENLGDKNSQRPETIAITADNLTLEKSFVDASTLGDGKGGNIAVNTSKNLAITGQDINLLYGIFSYSKEGKGDAGNIAINAGDSVELSDGGKISVDTYTSGRGGNIDLNAKNLLVDGQNNSNFAGLFANSFGTGKGGNLTLNVAGQVNLANNAGLNAIAYAAGDGGNVVVNTHDLVLDGQSQSMPFAIGTGSLSGTGNGGDIQVTADNSVNILNGAWINSSTRTSGNSGNIAVTAKDLLIDGQNNPNFTGIFTNAYRGSGNAGNITLAIANALNIYNGGQIASNTLEKGDAGNITLDTADITIIGPNSPLQTGVFSQALSGTGHAGQIELTATKDLNVLHGGQINSTTNTVGNGGNIVIKTKGNILIDDQQSGIDTGIASRTTESSTGDAGDISIATQGDIRVISHSSIVSGTTGAGAGGNIMIESAKKIQLDAHNIDNFNSGIFSDTSSTATGNAGDIQLKASNGLEILNGSSVSSSTFGKGSAGNIDIAGDNLIIDNNGKNLFFGILNIAFESSLGNAGPINIHTTGDVKVGNGGVINSSSYGFGTAGNVTLTSDGDILLYSDIPTPTGIMSTSGLFSPELSGNAGNITVTSHGDLNVLGNASINSSTYGGGNAGIINITTGRDLLLKGKTEAKLEANISSLAGPESTGNAGIIQANVGRDLYIIDYAGIDASTFNTGSGGEVNVTTSRDLLIDGLGKYTSETYVTGISTATLLSTGSAGDVTIKGRGNITILNNGSIDSNTFSAGNAGNIFVESQQNILIDGMSKLTGIYSNAIGDTELTNYKVGAVGSVKVKAANNLKLSNNGIISTAYLNNNISDVTFQPHLMQIEAKNIELINGGNFFAKAIGGFPASNIRITSNTLNLLSTVNNLDKTDSINSKIGTQAQYGSGGSIEINAKDWVQVKNSLISSSVNSDASANGGNIDISSDVVVLDTGFVRANGGGNNGRGGNINLNNASLVVSRDKVDIGQEQELPLVSGNNEIRATGSNKGIISYKPPELNIVSSLAGLTTPVLDSTAISHDPCAFSQKNSLKYLGQGGIKELNQGQDDVTIDLLLDQSAITPDFHASVPLPQVVRQTGCHQRDSGKSVAIVDL